jgi:hypothetical protein
MALAREAADPVLKQHYEDLALEFLRSLENERDLLTITDEANSSSGNTPR